MLIPCPVPKDRIPILESQLGSVRSPCAADFVSPLVAFLAMSRDSGRMLVGNLVWTFCQLSTVFPWLVDVENLQKAKHGSYSLRAGFDERPPADPVTGVRLESLRSGVLKYFAFHPTMINPKLLESAVREVKGWIGRGCLHSLSTAEAAASFHKKAACGWPYFKSATWSPLEYLHIAERIRNDGFDHRNAENQPGVVGTRGQPKGPGQYAKNRVIFGFPRALNILGKQVFAPTFSRLSQHDYFAAWRSRHDVDKGVTRLFRKAKGRALLSVDFSNFDATVPNELVDCAFDILCDWFDSADHSLIRFNQAAFKRTGILCPGEYFPGEHRLGGVPSGNVKTNLIDSIVNFLAIAYSAAEQGGRIVDALLQGDDGVYVFEGVRSLPRMSRVLFEHFGLVMSPDKCLHSAQMVSFLQNVHHKSYVVDNLQVGIRPLMRVLNGMMSYEKARKTDGSWSPVMDSFRWLQQLDNASAHPSFRQACRWLLDHDKDGMFEAMSAITRNDVDLLSYADSVLGGGDENKVRICDLYRSQVVRCCTELLNS